MHPLRFPRIELVNEYLRYSQRCLSMERWYHYLVENYPGADLRGFESWFWRMNFSSSPNFLPVPPEAEHISFDGEFYCFYPGCPKHYRSKQSRDNHFDTIHLGFRYLCDLCHTPFMNRNSVKKHKDWGRCCETKL
ncbi:hypothetical protein GYMLUDRAFT_606464 [Collybiopsis luxurians FD-317 M1]|uniref:C2H2-type domain-containing protein n=1 Tax=Collybiopsis luxurians FD-317 M1 TaxID=944289 RepID=A0A0D0BXG8_9AGAR|nr:hypothetical protein GYMLUDRAFT_606464 [Collybiopsis luxurians FD-317 M1]